MIQGVSPKDHDIPSGPIMRSKTKPPKEALNRLIQNQKGPKKEPKSLHSKVHQGI